LLTSNYFGLGRTLVNEVDEVIDGVLLEHEPTKKKTMLKDNAVFIGEVHDTTGGNLCKCHTIYG
jgi:hypothetical protein